MYEKPEVTRYSGGELLDLMGPVETAYCDLEGEQGVDDGECYIGYTLYLPEGRTIGDFEGSAFEFSGPCAEESGVCGEEAIEENCFFDSDAVPDSATSWDFAVDLCGLSEACDATGDWTLEMQLIEDGKRLPGCKITVSFEDPESTEP